MISPGPPKAISRQPRCSRCAVRSASSTTALAMFSGAPRIEPEVSRQTMIGPRSSASGGGGAALRRGGAAGSGTRVEQHRLALVGEQPALGQARAPQLVQHRVADLQRLAAQHALDAVGVADARQLAGRVGQARLAPRSAAAACARAAAPAAAAAGGGRACALGAAQPADQLGQRLQVRPAARRCAGPRAIRAQLSWPRSSSQRRCGQVAQALQQRQHLFPAARLDAATRRGSRAPTCGDGGVARQARLLVGDAVQVPQQRAQHLLGQRRRAAGTARAGPARRPPAQRAQRLRRRRSRRRPVGQFARASSAAASARRSCQALARCRRTARAPAPAATASRGSGCQPVVGRVAGRRIARGRRRSGRQRAPAAASARGQRSSTGSAAKPARAACQPRDAGRRALPACAACAPHQRGGQRGRQPQRGRPARGAAASARLRAAAPGVRARAQHLVHLRQPRGHVHRAEAAARCVFQRVAETMRSMPPSSVGCRPGCAPAPACRRRRRRASSRRQALLDLQLLLEGLDGAVSQGASCGCGLRQLRRRTSAAARATCAGVGGHHVGHQPQVAARRASRAAFGGGGACASAPTSWRQRRSDTAMPCARQPGRAARAALQRLVAAAPRARARRAAAAQLGGASIGSGARRGVVGAAAAARRTPRR